MTQKSLGKAITQLQANVVSLHTRAIELELVFVHSHNGYDTTAQALSNSMASYMSLLIEMSPTGYVSPTFYAMTFTIGDEEAGYYRSVMEILFFFGFLAGELLFLVANYGIQLRTAELADKTLSWRKTLERLWNNCLESASIAIYVMLVLLVMTFPSGFVAAGLRDQLVAAYASDDVLIQGNGTTTTAVSSSAVRTAAEFQVPDDTYSSAVNGLLEKIIELRAVLEFYFGCWAAIQIWSCMAAFLMIESNIPSLALTTQTIAKASKVILWNFVIFLLFILGSAGTFHALYSHYDWNFHSFGSSFLTMFLMAIGIIDFEQREL